MTRRISHITHLCFLFASVTVSILLFSTDTVHATLSVSGSVTIPFNAPAGGVDIELYLEDTDSYSNVSRPVTIPAGQNSVSYLPLDTTGFDNGRLRYYCLSNCGDIYPGGYLTPAGTSFKWEDARVFTVGDYPAANLDLPLGFRVTGEVNLPDLDTAGEEIWLEVTASETQYYSLQAENVAIPAGESSVNYSLLLPPDPSGFWMVNYFITSGGQNLYYHTGYYLTQNTTTYISTNAAKLYGSTSYSLVNMTVLRGKSITGSLSLPGGRQAPAGDLEICMDTVNYQYYGGEDKVTVTIPEGGSSVDYLLMMPLDQYNSWEVRYSCCYYSYTKCINEGYLTTGFYAGPDEPTFFVSKGYGLWAGDNHAAVDLDLISAKAIGGTLTLPKAAPAGGAWLTVYADDPVYPGAMFDTLFIPAGSQSALYEVYIPENPSLNWRVSHRFDAKIGYVQEAYYAAAGTTHLKNKATMLNGGTDHYHIDMNALPDRDNDGIPDSIDPVNNVLNSGMMLLLLR